MKRGALIGGAIACAVVAGMSCVGDSSTTDGGTDGTVDQSSADQLAVDVGGDAGPCDLTKPFGPSTLIPSPNNASGSLTADELNLFYSFRVDAGPYEIYTATRLQSTAAFGTGTDVGAAVNNSPENTNIEPAISANGLTLVFTEGCPAGQLGNCTTGSFYDLVYSTRGSLSSPWAAATVVPNVNSPQDEHHAFLRADGKALYFTSTRGEPNGDLYVSTINAGAFSAPGQLAELNTTGTEDNAAVTQDGLMVFWSSDRGGGQGGLDIWMATRTDTQSLFQNPMNVSELNTAGNDRVTGVSPNGCRLYFSSSGFRYADRP